MNLFVSTPENAKFYDELYKAGYLGFFGHLGGNSYCLTGNVWERFPDERKRLETGVKEARNRKILAAIKG